MLRSVYVVADFTHILQDYFISTKKVHSYGCPWSNTEEYGYIDGLVQERCNSSTLAMELHLSCINLSI